MGFKWNFRATKFFRAVFFFAAKFKIAMSGEKKTKYFQSRNILIENFFRYRRSAATT